MPAWLKAQRLGTKAARVGFDWDTADQITDKIEEELGELKQAVGRDDPEAVKEELGDLLFSAAMLARKLDIDPEGALEQTNLKFSRRFRWIEGRLERDGRSVAEASSEQLEQLWQSAKEQTDRQS